MDPYDGEVLGERFDPKFELLRLSLGYSMRYAKKMNMAEMIPHNNLASTQYCLANPGNEYLIYLPDGGEVAVDLSATSGTFAVEWFNPETGEAISSEAISGSEIKKLVTPFDGDAVLYILKLK